MPYTTIETQNGIELKRVDLIVTADITKRGLPSREMEEIASLIAIKTGKPYAGSLKESLNDLREHGSNMRPVFNITADDKVPSIFAPEAPVGIVRYCLLNHIPSMKLKYSNKLNIDWRGCTKRGMKNYNWTDALSVFKAEGCTGIIDEIQNYQVHTNNYKVLKESLNAIGFDITGKNIHPSKDGVIKQSPIINLPIINTFANNETVENTMFDVKFENRTIQIEIPENTRLFIKDYAKLCGCKGNTYDSVYNHLTSLSGKEALHNNNLKLNDVISHSNQKRYLVIPGHMLHYFVDLSGKSNPSFFIKNCNKLIGNLLTQSNQNYSAEYRENRLNQLFNNILEAIVKDTLTKNGILRETISPRTAFSSFGVASNSGGDPNIVYIPIKMLQHYAQKSEFREIYNIESAEYNDVKNAFTNTEHRCLVMRHPCHHREEVSSYIVRPWNDSTIGISAASMGIKSGKNNYHQK